MEIDVETFNFLLVGHAQTDHRVDHLENDEGADRAPGDDDERAPELSQNLAGVAVDQTLLPSPPITSTAKTPVRMAPTKPPIP